MFVELLTSTAARPFSWIDLCDPSLEELAETAAKHGLASAALHDCMRAALLPQHRVIGRRTHLLIVRAHDATPTRGTDSVQSMTKKLGLFVGDGWVISVHRRPLPLLEAVAQRWSKSEEVVTSTAAELALELVLAAVDTFQEPLEAAELQIHEFEAATLFERKSDLQWEPIVETKTRIRTLKRLLWHTSNALGKLALHLPAEARAVTDARAHTDNLALFADGLDDDLDSLLNVQLSLASHRTNEVMRILTIFSAFFLPITFIAGVYGMNFEHMPELPWRYGYAGVWGAIIATVVSVALWFRRNGWLGR